jgi:hypothetical protein
MVLTADRLAARCREDGEFRLCARFWDGSLTLVIGETRLQFAVDGGVIRAGTGNGEATPQVTVEAPAEAWEKILAPVPPPFFNDIMPARAFGLSVKGDEETFWQYYPAIRRLVDILREEWAP